jgi:membrane protease YdiL (CAAX protease family)
MKYEMLPINLAFDFQDLRIFIPVVGGLIAFLLFWFIQKSDKVKQKFLAKYGEDKGQARFVIFTKYLGGFTMGVIPAALFIIAFPETTLQQLGIGFNRETAYASLLWIIGISAIIVPIISLGARKPDTMAIYPEIRLKKWSYKMVVSYFASWAAYLLGYEILFRGVMLFPLVDKIGLWPAIAVNIGMYSATHIAKGLNETIGAIPLSVILCLLTVLTGNIWIAFFVHVAMAWTSNITALKFNPEMKIIKK